METQQGVLFTNDCSQESIIKLVDKMNAPTTTAGILFYNNIHEAFNQLKQQFTLVPAAGGFVINTQNDILLIFRRGKWDLPKGKLDEGENIRECAVREIREETGIEAKIEKPLVITYHTYKEKGRYILKESHWFLMKTDQTNVQPQTEEDIELCEWVKPVNLGPYFSNTHASIADVLQLGLTCLQNP